MLSTPPTTERKRYTLIGVSEHTQLLRAEIETAARTDTKVLLTGETGVGKEVVAHEVHRHSRRARQPFITINCAGVPDTLLESEFFGHTRGSFTGAFRDSPGMLRQAHGGTVFLDEVGEMSLRMQALFLRFLETGEIQTVGGGAGRTHVDVRIVTATNRNLAESVAAQEFREDLYYRLNVFHVRIPPLRERQVDIPLLLDHYVRHFAERNGRTPPSFTSQALAVLCAYAWPGNIRELMNVVEWIVSRDVAAIIEPAHLPRDIVAAASAAPPDSPGPSPRDLSHPAKVEALLDRMVKHGEPFWTTAYAAFMARDLTRDDMRYIIRTGLEHTRGSYRTLLSHFNMNPEDYKRLLGFLKQHDCHLPFQRFRMLNNARTTERRNDAASA
jgi:DNA-binding NtrC family response regulator